MRISVIIPALNEAPGILSCLGSVTSRQGEFELIVVDGGSVDRTIEVAQPHARVVRCRHGRALQMNSGHARPPVMYSSPCTRIRAFLHAPFC